MVDGLVTRLEQHGVLENTYIVYSSDNGFHIGQHRLQPGKSCGYEEDINIPLIVRGAGVAKNYSTDIVTTHTDLAPTFFELLGIPLHDEFDGRPIPVTREGIEQKIQERREHAGVEYWGFAGGEGKYDRMLDLFLNVSCAADCVSDSDFGQVLFTRTTLIKQSAYPARVIIYIIRSGATTSMSSIPWM